MSKTYVKDTCPLCGTTILDGDVVVYVQRAIATSEGLESLNRRAMKEGEMRLKFIPGTGRGYHDACYQREKSGDIHTG